jgi:hypothetical protein
MAIFYQNVHLVELDLLFGGKRLPMQKPLPPGDYYYLVSHADQRPDCQVYYWSLREALPKLPVPLRTPDRDLLIDLGAVFATGVRTRSFPTANQLPSPAGCPLAPGRRGMGQKGSD